VTTDGHRLSIEFENDDSGRRWDQITEYEIDDSFLVPTDGWQVTVYDPDPRFLRRKFRPLEPVRIYLGDRLQVTGRIDGTEGVGGGSTALRVWGRDYIADLVNPNIDPSVRVRR
jgi:prophage tail gpP-like protein